MKSIQILFQKWQSTKMSFLAIALTAACFTSSSVNALTMVSVNITVQKETIYTVKNNRTTIPTNIIGSVPVKPLANGYEEFLLQISASRNEVRIRELAAFFQEMGFVVYLIIEKTAPYPFKLIIGNAGDSWASARTFKEQHKSMIPQDAFIHRPHTITQTLLPFKD